MQSSNNSYKIELTGCELFSGKPENFEMKSTKKLVIRILITLSSLSSKKINFNYFLIRTY